MNNSDENNLLKVAARELTSSTDKKSVPMTMKDLLRAIRFDLIALKHHIIFSSESSKAMRRTSIIALAMLCLFLLWSLAYNRPDSDWLRTNQFELFSIGLLAGVLAVLLSTEELPLAKAILSSTSCRIVIGFFFAFMVAIATASANSALNSVTGLDASNMPIARAFLVTALVLKLAWPAFLLLGSVAVVHAIGLTRFMRRVLKREDSFGEVQLVSIALVVSTALVGYAYARVLFNGFRDDVLPSKAYLLASKYDFNDRALCLEEAISDELRDGSKFLFIGSDQRTVLVAPKPIQTELDPSFFFEARLGFDLQFIKPTVYECRGKSISNAAGEQKGPDPQSGSSQP